MSLAKPRWDRLAEALTAAKTAGLSDEEVTNRYGQAVQETARKVVHELRERASQMLAEHARDRVGFEERLYERWGEGLDRFYEVVVCAQEIGASFTDDHMQEAGADNDLVFEVLSRNHARACLGLSLGSLSPGAR